MIDSNSKPCITLDETLCIYRAQTIFRTKKFDEICPNECPAECNALSYAYSTSFSHYPAKPYANQLLQDPKIIARFDDPTTASYDKLKNNILAVNIYFDNLESTQIYESEQTLLVDLIAGIGGTLGLFLGVSMLSFFEIFEIFFELLFLKCSKTNKVKQTK
jgi:acid-sensing ion channel 5